MKYLELKDNLRFFDSNMVVALAERLISEFQDFAYGYDLCDDAVDKIKETLDEFDLQYEVNEMDEEDEKDDFNEVQDDFEFLTPDEFLDKYL